MSGRLVVAVPSKGRLQENAAAFFARARLDLTKPGGARDYRGAFRGVPDVDVLFLSASEIARELARGGAHLGVTGLDLVREDVADWQARLELLAPLGFGHANVVVAVPQAWIDVRSMADLDDVAADLRARQGRRMRIATKYVNLTRQFFSERGVGDYRIVESAGATEGAPAAGAAEAIVDITTTGATLAANGLKVIEDGTILESQAHLVASVTTGWSEPAREAARGILARIAAEEIARTHREVRVAASAALDTAKAANRFGAVALAQDAGAARLLCPVGQVYALADWLIARGAGDVTVGALDYVFSPANPLWDRLATRIAAQA